MSHLHREKLHPGAQFWRFQDRMGGPADLLFGAVVAGAKPLVSWLGSETVRGRPGCHYPFEGRPLASERPPARPRLLQDPLLQ